MAYVPRPTQGDAPAMKMIYVDDDAINRTVLKQMLATAGVTIDEAADARTGLRMIAENDYDLIVMDLRMPDINGLTAIRQLRARKPAGGHVPVVVISAELSPGTQDLCRSAGADGFIEKPVNMDRLFDVIGTAIARAERDFLL